MKKIALIPARYGATRFPGKMMADLGGKSVILRTYESAAATGLFDDVYVVTDSDIIFENIASNGGKAIMSTREHECGTDRIAEAARQLDADIIVNVQGDVPFTTKEPLEKLLAAFEGEAGREVQIASPMMVLAGEEQIRNPNFVKVVVDLRFNALFFSRSVLPYPRDTAVNPTFYKHIGIYAFRRETLLRVTQLPVSPLEAAEKIECLRYLENGIRMKMVVTGSMGVEIDTPEDLERALKTLQ